MRYIYRLSAGMIVGLGLVSVGLGRRGSLAELPSGLGLGLVAVEFLLLLGLEFVLRLEFSVFNVRVRFTTAAISIIYQVLHMIKRGGGLRLRLGWSGTTAWGSAWSAEAGSEPPVGLSTEPTWSITTYRSSPIRSNGSVEMGG